MSKKIKTMRMTGYPVELEQKEAMLDEWREVFDRAVKKCKVKDSDTAIDQLRLQKLLARIESILANKYPTLIEWDMLVTEEQWQEVQKEYGNIMVTSHKDTGEMLYVIMDEEETRY